MRKARRGELPASSGQAQILADRDSGGRESVRVARGFPAETRGDGPRPVRGDMGRLMSSPGCASLRGWNPKGGSNVLEPDGNAGLARFGFGPGPKPGSRDGAAVGPMCSSRTGRKRPSTAGRGGIAERRCHLGRGANLRRVQSRGCQSGERDGQGKAGEEGVRRLRKPEGAS